MFLGMAAIRSSFSRLCVLDRQLAHRAKEDQEAKRLMTVPGVGPITATALVALAPTAQAFKKGRDFAAWLGLTPLRSETVTPAMFGASPRLPHSTIEQRALNIDGGAGTALYRFDGILENLGFLRYDVTNLAYAIPDLKTGAVIRVGGGRDVLSQRIFALSDVTGVEIEVDEARSWFARTPRSFDVIQMSLIDTWAATGAGAFTLTENGLYTVEAWQRFLDRLNPGGLFTVSRWYAPGEV